MVTKEQRKLKYITIETKIEDLFPGKLVPDGAPICRDSMPRDSALICRDFMSGSISVRFRTVIP